MTRTSLIVLAAISVLNLSAASIAGTVRDTHGNALGDAQVILTSAEGGSKQDTFTGTEGKFSFSELPAGEYLFKLQKQGMKSVYRVYSLTEDAPKVRQFTMVMPGNGSDVEAIMDPSTGEKPRQIRIGGQVAEANVVTKIAPKYPVEAKQAGFQGTVELMATISKEGVPVELRVSSSPDDSLSEASLVAVRQWRYRPTLLNGEPIEVITNIVVNYTLSK